MKQLKLVPALILALTARLALGQGYGGQLTFQGVDHCQLHSVASRAMGGVTVATQDVASMFNNPAVLASLAGLRVSVGGAALSHHQEQKQNYAPVRYYANLSLLLEGLTSRIPDPNPELPGFTAADTVQRPYDDIGPNWSRSSSSQYPLHFFAAVPFQVSAVKFCAGLGAVQYADLSHFYQHNNVLSPSILSQRPLPTMRPSDDNPLVVDWYQTVRSRNGAIRGYGLALAARVEKLRSAFGVSALLLRGSSDDEEKYVGRGRLTFFANAFRADSVGWRLRKSGTSRFKGQEVALSWLLTGSHASLGLTVRPPAKIKRELSAEVESVGLNEVANAALVAGLHAEGKDRLQLPWRGSAGLSITPKEWLILGFEYELRPYKSARYVDPFGKESSPWLSSSPFRVGFELRALPWLAVRAGMRNEAEVFEPEGNQLPGEPVTYSVYSCGASLIYGGLRVDLAVENSLMKYQDIWSSAISKNSERRWIALGQLAYQIPWRR
ncbi:MAG: hypothetical protein QHJ34_00235 [bacterium]|jgi:hypothetical protein|nr:hypothetical protein [candidate division KSB1 bacterium]MDH7558652.1 hypothetical protein [bacterium]